MDIRIRIGEGDDDIPPLQWDTVWNPERGEADWALADPDEARNAGGLRAKSAIATAVLLALFSDRRCPENHPLRYLADSDPRGWWGDGIDVREGDGETELGSLLWLLERAPLMAGDTERWAVSLAQEALAPLVAQGACARIDVSAQADEIKNRIELFVALYARDGQRIYDRRFEVLWRQIGA